MIRNALVTTALALAIAPAALAEQTSGDEYQHVDIGLSAAQIFDSMDRNDDKAVTPQEFAGGALEERFEALDQNSDGRLSRQEYLTADASGMTRDSQQAEAESEQVQDSAAIEEADQPEDSAAIEETDQPQESAGADDTGASG